MKHLKQLLLGAVLFEGGILGFVGFLIACTQKVAPGARSTVLLSACTARKTGFLYSALPRWQLWGWLWL